VLLFFALCFLGVAIAGASAFVIFWPLALVALRDGHPDARARLGDGAFLHPAALWWLLSGHYREVRDPAFTGLATPATVALATILVGLGGAAILWLWAVALG
jgi:hypothetical protein